VSLEEKGYQMNFILYSLSLSAIKCEHYEQSLLNNGN